MIGVAKALVAKNQVVAAGGAIDISATSYDSKFFDAWGQISGGRVAILNADGTRLYVGDNNVNPIFQYDLSTAFDISTAVYNSVSFDPTAQVPNISGLAFNSDGTRMFATGYSNDLVAQYDLSTGFDISTAVYNSVSFAVTSVPMGLAFSLDGSKMYIDDSGDGSVHQYDLSTPFDISTAVDNAITFSHAAEHVSQGSITISEDGTQLFCASDNSIFQYTLATPYLISSASYDSVAYTPASAGINDIYLAEGESKMYLLHTSPDYKIRQYTLS